MHGMGARPRQWTQYISTQMKLTIRASLQSKAIGIGYIIKRFKIQLEVGYLIQWFWPQCLAPECGVCTYSSPRSQSTWWRVEQSQVTHLGAFKLARVRVSSQLGGRERL